MRENIMQKRLEAYRLMKSFPMGSRESSMAFEQLYNLCSDMIEKFQKKYKPFFREDVGIYVLESFFKIVNEYKEEYTYDFTSFLLRNINKDLLGQINKNELIKIPNSKLVEILKEYKQNPEETISKYLFYLDRINLISLDENIKVRNVENEIEYLPISECIWKGGKSYCDGNLIDIAIILLSKLSHVHKKIYLSYLMGENITEAGKDFSLERRNSWSYKNKAEIWFKERMDIAKDILFISDNIKDYLQSSFYRNLTNSEIADYADAVFTARTEQMVGKNVFYNKDDFISEIKNFTKMFDKQIYKKEDIKEMSRIGTEIKLKFIALRDNKNRLNGKKELGD